MLEKTFVTRNQTFAAGAPAYTDISLSYYELGFLYHLPKKYRDNRLTLSPGIDVAAFDFKFDISDHGAAAARAYMKTGVRLGGRAAYQASDKLRLESTLFWGLPLPNTPDIRSLQFLGRYDFWHSQRTTLSGLFGATHQWIDYEDQQELPNHIVMKSGVMPTIGLSLRY